MKRKKIKKKLLSMRFTQKQMSKFNKEESFEAYGWTECINSLLIWIKK